MASTQSSPVRLRQIALVSANLACARHELTTILGVPVIYEDPAVGQWGLENILVPLGGDTVEVVAPTRPGTTAGRLLDKRGGDGGYMIIMQTDDAVARRRQIEASGRSTVIFSHPFSHTYASWKGVAKDEGHCIQYHPKGFPGGVMPELDSHAACAMNPRPLLDRFSPWHPCGADYDRYVRDMKRTSHLHLIGCNLQLAGQGADVAARAATQWSDAFGMPVSRGGELVFTNARLGFSHGQGRAEGLSSITVAVDGAVQMREILDRARAAGKTVHDDNGAGDWFEMVGVRWNFVSLDAKQQSAGAGRDSRL